MLSFRYHALSLVAVFLALVIGLLLGVAVGDKGLVSSAESDVRDSLRSDVREAQQERDAARDKLEQRLLFEADAYPALVADRLSGMRVALIELGGASDRIWELTRDALQGSGARLTSVSVIRAPLDLAALANAAKGTRYARLGGQSELAERFGHRIGIQFTRGGKLLQRVRDPLLEQGSGSLAGAQGIVIARDPAELADPLRKSAMQAFEQGLMRGLRRDGVRVVGVETTDADPSQIEWFKQHDISSVDDLDDPLGRAALVFALAGQRGHFGVKPSADGGRLPPAL